MVFFLRSFLMAFIIWSRKSYMRPPQTTPLYQRNIFYHNCTCATRPTKISDYAVFHLLVNFSVLTFFCLIYPQSIWVTHFSPMFHFYTPWKCLTFSGGIELEHSARWFYGNITRFILWQNEKTKCILIRVEIINFNNLTTLI